MKDEEMKFDPENSERRRDSRNLQGELPWPRLLTIKNRPSGRLVYTDKSGKAHLTENLSKNKNFANYKHEKDPRKAPFKVETARICMPNASIFENSVYADSVSPSAFWSLLGTRMGDRIPWFTFNQYKNWEWNTKIIDMIKQDKWIYAPVIVEKKLSEFENKELIPLIDNSILVDGKMFVNPKGSMIVEVPDNTEFDDRENDDFIKVRIENLSITQRKWLEKQMKEVNDDTVVRYTVRSAGSTVSTKLGSKYWVDNFPGKRELPHTPLSKQLHKLQRVKGSTLKQIS